MNAASLERRSPPVRGDEASTLESSSALSPGYFRCLVSRKRLNVRLMQPILGETHGAAANGRAAGVLGASLTDA